MQRILGNLTGTLSSTQITSGMSVSKYGNTTNLQTGTVISASASVQVQQGSSLTDQVKIDIAQQQGDSGAPVTLNFIGPTPPGGTKPVMLIGIATIANQVTWKEAFASKADNINYAFNLNTYVVV